MESGNGLTDWKTDPKDPVQCVVYLFGVGSAEPTKFYGPFANHKAAIDWICSQPSHVGFAIGLLRTPNKARTYEEFYLPARLDKEEDFVEL